MVASGGREGGNPWLERLGSAVEAADETELARQPPWRKSKWLAVQGGEVMSNRYESQRAFSGGLRVESIASKICCIELIWN
jgi:hypothetical protein